MIAMSHHVVSVEHVGGMRLRIRFDDGAEGDVDLARRIRRYPGFMAKLLVPEYFAKVFVHPEFRTVSWPGDEIDLDRIVLYSWVTGRSIKSLLTGYPPPPPRKPAKRRAAKARSASAR
jgi:Protein of unknown function (DUF2442)